MEKLTQKFKDYLKFGRKRDGLIDEVDSRNFGAEIAATISTKDLVKESFVVLNIEPQDQLDSDYCAGFSGAYSSEQTEGMQCSGSFLFAMAKKLSGSYKGWGTSILKISQARTKFGVCNKSSWEYKKGKRDYYANWNNIPEEVYKEAEQHKAKSYYQVSKGFNWSMFDTIRAYLKITGKTINTGATGHAITIIGYVDENQNFSHDFPEKLKKIIKDNNIKDKLIALDSYGERTYYNGYRFIDRVESEALFTPYITLDIPRNLADILNEYDQKCIKTKDDPKCYLVRGGQRCHLKNPMTALSHNILLQGDVFTITDEDMSLIPEGKMLSFYEGKFAPLVKRCIEFVDKERVEELINI